MELNPFFTIKKVLCFMGTNINKHRHFSYKQVNWKRRILTLCSEIMPLVVRPKNHLASLFLKRQ